MESDIGKFLDVVEQVMPEYSSNIGWEYIRAALPQLRARIQEMEARQGELEYVPGVRYDMRIDRSGHKP